MNELSEEDFKMKKSIKQGIGLLACSLLLVAF